MDLCCLQAVVTPNHLIEIRPQVESKFVNTHQLRPCAMFAMCRAGAHLRFGMPRRAIVPCASSPFLAGSSSGNMLFECAVSVSSSMNPRMRPLAGLRKSIFRPPWSGCMATSSSVSLLDAPGTVSLTYPPTILAKWARWSNRRRSAVVASSMAAAVSHRRRRRSVLSSITLATAASYRPTRFGGPHWSENSESLRERSMWTAIKELTVPIAIHVQLTLVAI